MKLPRLSIQPDLWTIGIFSHCDIQEDVPFMFYVPKMFYIPKTQICCEMLRINSRTNTIANVNILAEAGKRVIVRSEKSYLQTWPEREK